MNPLSPPPREKTSPLAVGQWIEEVWRKITELVDYTTTNDTDIAEIETDITTLEGYVYAPTYFSWTTLTNPTSGVITAPSEGTKTVTLPAIGVYQVVVTLVAEHSQTFTECDTAVTFGGTSTRRGNARTFNMWADEGTDGNHASACVELFEATVANQTVTIAPTGRVAYGSAGHFFYFGYQVTRVY